MNELPKMVQLAPKLLYAAAVIYFVVSILLIHFQLDNAFQGSNLINDGSYARLALLSAYLQAAAGSAYLAGYGVIIRILLAIWRNGNGRPPGQGADE